MTQDQAPTQGKERATTNDAGPQRAHSVYKPTKWATSVPTLLRADGRPDTVAHHVLLVMATYANPDGTSIRASIATLTRKSHLTTQKSVTDALQRLEKAKLIIRAGELTGGTVVWKLNFEIEGDEDDLYEERAAQRRAANAERQRRRRQRLAEPQSHGLPERDVTAYHPVTHGLPERESRGDGRDNARSAQLHQPFDQPVTSPHGPNDGGTLPPDPLRTESPQAAPRTELEPTLDSSKTSPTGLDLSTHVPHAREALDPVDLATKDTELNSDEIRQRVDALKAQDPMRFSNARRAARKALGLGQGVTTSPKHREALNRAIYRAYREEATPNAS